MEEPPDQKPLPPPLRDGWNAAPEEDWGGAPVTKFRCPVHLVPEAWQIVSQDGQRLIHYSCPIEGCGHEWTVKRIRA
jgi:hypothetical protein